MLGARISALRHQMGISQAQLARQLGVSPSAVGLYEQGRREPSAQLLISMARIFDVSLDYLMTGSLGQSDADSLGQLLLSRIAAADHRLDNARRERPFTRDELAVLFAAMLLEP